MLRAPSMTWLLVSTSPEEVITMPVPAASPPPERVTLTSTTPAMTLEVSDDPALPPLPLPLPLLLLPPPPKMPPDPVPPLGFPPLPGVGVWIDEVRGDEDGHRVSRAPSPAAAATTKTPPKAAAASTRRCRRGGAGGVGSHDQVPHCPGTPP